MAKVTLEINTTNNKAALRYALDICSKAMHECDIEDCKIICTK